MSRRGRFGTINRHADGQRSSVGDFYVDKAVTLLNRTALIEINMMVPTIFTRPALTDMLFPDDKIDKLMAVLGMVDAACDIVDYSVGGGLLFINWDGAPLPAPQPGMLCVHLERAAPLFEAIAQMSLIREKYAAVVHILRWFNRNVTPAATRAMWPAVMALCPESPLCREYAAMPSRYSAPADAGRYAHLMRDTAGTVAAMQMLPSDLAPRAKGNAWLTFETETLTREDIEFACDPLTVNL